MQMCALIHMAHPRCATAHVWKSGDSFVKVRTSGIQILLHHVEPGDRPHSRSSGLAVSAVIC